MVVILVGSLAVADPETYQNVQNHFSPFVNKIKRELSLAFGAEVVAFPVQSPIGKRCARELSVVGANTSRHILLAVYICVIPVFYMRITAHKIYNGPKRTDKIICYYL